VHADHDARQPDKTGQHEQQAAPRPPALPGNTDKGRGTSTNSLVTWVHKPATTAASSAAQNSRGARRIQGSTSASATAPSPSIVRWNHAGSPTAWPPWFSHRNSARLVSVARMPATSASATAGGSQAQGERREAGIASPFDAHQQYAAFAEQHADG
jgi:hypothetical protein